MTMSGPRFLLVLVGATAMLFVLDRITGMDPAFYQSVLFLFVLTASSAYIFLGGERDEGEDEGTTDHLRRAGRTSGGVDGGPDTPGGRTDAEP
ncbi:MAG: hypothetical protein QF415_09240 [Candidatus Undinarchaeales archaeon]|nr:hypothetical protein [Candidatus Undinarchaeales archaeon]MDP7493012.1 hypothetical protein [Candidatus Undinarchaeales archaeon]